MKKHIYQMDEIYELAKKVCNYLPDRFNVEICYELLLGVKKKYPQLNSQTTIELTDKPYLLYRNYSAHDRYDRGAGSLPPLEQVELKTYGMYRHRLNEPYVLYCGYCRENDTLYIQKKSGLRYTRHSRSA